MSFQSAQVTFNHFKSRHQPGSFQVILEITLLGPFRSFQGLLGPFRAFQVLLGPFRSFQVHLGHFRSFQAILGHFWSFLVIFGHFWSFLVILGHFRSFQVIFWSFLVLVTTIDSIRVMQVNQAWQDYQVQRVIRWSFFYLSMDCIIVTSFAMMLLDQLQ